jgi:exonuclease III
LVIELKVDIIVIQEPFITRGNDGNIDLITARSIAHPSFTQILPKYSGFRPRTLVYISKAYNPSISVSTLSLIDSDFLIVDITQNNQKIRLYNIYNQNRQNNKTTHNYPLQQLLYNQILEPNSIILGDFNIHHPWWDPLAGTPSIIAKELAKWIENKDLELHNKPGKGTFYRPHIIRPSVIDLTITTKNIANQVTDWQILDLVGSDHFGIMFTINGTNTPYIEDASTSTHFRTELANWDLFTTTLKANIAKSTILCSDTLKNIKKSIKSINILQSQSEPPERLNSTISTTNSLYTSNHTSLGQNAELDNSALNSLIAQTAQLAIWTTV